MNVKVIAFDADDTLWDCQSFFFNVEHQYCELLAAYGDEDHISQELFKTETANMEELGYGCKAFTLSLVENAIKVSKGKIDASYLLEIQELGRSLLRLPATPLPEVEETLKAMKESGRFRMVVFTKGELQDQLNKMRRSGLVPLFDDIIVVADKTPEAYAKLCNRFCIDIRELLMVGNSFKSDVEPVLQLGGYAVHIPFEYMWAHEHAETYEHPQLKTITHFSELLSLLGINSDTEYI